WDLLLEYALSVATVAVGWSGNLRSLLADAGLALPASAFDWPAALAVAAVTALLVRGVRESAAVNSAIVLVKVAVILVVIGCGAMFVQPALWQPFVPPNTGTFGEFGWSGVLRGAAVIFFAY